MYDAIILAGGSGRRLGGVDKAALEIDGRSLLERVLAAVEQATDVVVVGPPRALPSGIQSTSEQPAGGGPAAGLAAGLELIVAPVVVVLACDLPHMTSETVQSLVDALAGDGAAETDGSALVDASGRRQHLAAAYRTDSLRAAVAAMGDLRGAPLRDVVAGLVMLELPVTDSSSADCDTWDDVRQARSRGHHDR